jgi:exopolyphosphatase / guanosine-5'-triphosphate,3'-diphosphate pyrophosphatase
MALQVGRVVDDQIYPFDSIKDTVRIASGLTANKQLDEAAQTRALASLARFGERLRGFRRDSVRAVATSALRVARNADTFLPRAEEALGFPIEIIRGREEARLIYIGAHHALPPSEQTRLVVDIGGGSTEFIIGRKNEPLLTESLNMGCVSFTHAHFPDGKVTRRGFRQAEMAAAAEIEGIAGDYRRFGWGKAFGSSGTARAIARILELNSLNPDGSAGITREGLDNLRERIVHAGTADTLALDGLPTDRLSVLPAGAAIMSAILSCLEIPQMHPARGALRLGVMYDLLGRFHQQDMRDTTVRQFMRRYRVDMRQAERVEKAALALLAQLFDPNDPAREDERRFLRWAAQLHEIGLSIAHGGFHKHGAYIIDEADMPGFSRKDQSRLSRLVLGQRGNLLKLADVQPGDTLWHLVACLRLAALLYRSRRDFLLPDIRIDHQGQAYRLEVPRNWLSENRMSAAALVEESQAWMQAGMSLQVIRRAC